MAYNHHIYKPKIGGLELCKFYSQLQNTCNRAHRRLFYVFSSKERGAMPKGHGNKQHEKRNLSERNGGEKLS